MRFRFAVAILATALLAAAVGCGGEDLQSTRDRVKQTRKDIEQGLARAQDQFEERRQRLGQRISEVLDQLDKAFSRPERTSPTVRSRGRNEPTTSTPS